MLTQIEKQLLESISGMLQQKAKLGLAVHDKDEDQENERGLEHMHNYLQETFAHKISDLAHYDGIRAAFAKTHSYKYLDDPTFTESMDKDMKAMVIPADERQQAKEAVLELVKEMKKGKADWSERDYGFNKNLSDLREQ